MTQRCWSKYRRYPFRSLLRSREMLIGKICTPNLVSLAGPWVEAGVLYFNSPGNRPNRLSPVRVQQIMIELYPVRSMGWSVTMLRRVRASFVTGFRRGHLRWRHLCSSVYSHSQQWLIPGHITEVVPMLNNITAVLHCYATRDQHPVKTTQGAWCDTGSVPLV